MSTRLSAQDLSGGQASEGITTLSAPSHGPRRKAPRLALTVDATLRPTADPSSGRTVELGTTWGPHALHAGRRPARRVVTRTAPAPPLTRTDAYSCVLGVKGSQGGHQGVSVDALGFSIRYAGEQGGRAVGDRERIVESRVGVLGRCVEYRSGR